MTLPTQNPVILVRGCVTIPETLRATAMETGHRKALWLSYLMAGEVEAEASCSVDFPRSEIVGREEAEGGREGRGGLDAALAEGGRGASKIRVCGAILGRSGHAHASDSRTEKKTTS